MRLIHPCLVSAYVIGLVSCAGPSPKSQAFPTLERQIEQHVKAGDKVVYPQLIHSIKPEFPALPASGSVWAVMRVGTQGRVTEVKIVGQAPEPFQSSINQALLKWQFKRGSINGRPSEFPMQVKITFAESSQPEVVKAAKSQTGLILDFRDWLVRSSFPELIDDIEKKKRGGQKLVWPKLAKAPNDIKHPDPTKTGTVYTAFIINAKGRPENIHIFGDIPKEFQETISKAILRAEYTPATLNGKPHACPTGMPFRFLTHGHPAE